MRGGRRGGGRSRGPDRGGAGQFAQHHGTVRVAPRDGPARFVFLGRMIPHKGVEWLLRAATRVREDVRLDLAGTGNQEGEYRELAKEVSAGATPRSG